MSRSERVQEALGIPGWMEEAELSWLEEQARAHRYIAEIGSWQGRSTKVLAATGGIVFAIDDWRGEADNPVAELDALFDANLELELKTGKVKIVETPSPEAAKDFAEGFAVEGSSKLQRLDLVFIDGSHNYPNPLLDIQAWRPVLAEGGMLCGHDMSIPGVTQAITEELGADVENPAGSIWVAK